MEFPDRALLVTDEALMERASRFVRADDEPHQVDGLTVRVGDWGAVRVAVAYAEEPAHALRALVDRGVRVAVLAGTGLGMNPLLVPGTLVIVEHAVAPGADAASDEDLKEGLEAALGGEFCRWQCSGAASAPETASPEVLLDLRQRGGSVLVEGATAFLREAAAHEVAAASVFVIGDELARFAGLDEDAPGGLVWDRREADPKVLQGPSGAMLRGAFGAVTGYKPDGGDA